VPAVINWAISMGREGWSPTLGTNPQNSNIPAGVFGMMKGPLAHRIPEQG
jgi:hypothetical protein